LGFVALLVSGTAWADEPVSQPAPEPVRPESATTSEQDVLGVCIAAYEDAQRKRNRGDLIEAREALKVCSREVCPAIARTDCTGWLGELRVDVPTIVVGARFEGGRDVIDVKVFLDGKPLMDRIEGRAVEVNPGVHTLRFERQGSAPVEERVSILVGERNRRVIVTIPDPTPPPAPAAEPSSGIPTMTYVLGGVGALGLAGFGFLGLTGLSREGDLDACKPSCPSGDVDAVRTRYLAADISLLVGLAALGGATYFYFESQGQGMPERAAVGVGLRAGPSEVGAAIGGRF
jgi:hypothetical protein